MANPMQGYLVKQPKVLTDIFDGFDYIAKPFRGWCDSLKPRRLFIIGSGSSCYIAEMARPFLEELLKMEIDIIVPSRAANIHVPLDDEKYLIVSQEGKSVNTYAALERLNRAGARIAALTAMPDSPIAKNCDTHLLIDCGPEYSGPKTVGVAASYVVLCLAALEMALCWGCIDKERYDKFRKELSKSISALEKSIIASMEWYKNVKESVQQAPSIAVISNRRLLGAGMEGVLKLQETIYMPGTAYEMEEFIHGPHCLLGTAVQLILLIQSGQDNERLKDLCTFAREKGMTVYPILERGLSVMDGALSLYAAGRFSAPHFLIPFQIISAYLSEEMGHDLNKPKYEGFAQRFGSKMF